MLGNPGVVPQHPLGRGNVEQFVAEGKAVPLDLELGGAGAKVADKDGDVALVSKAKDGQGVVIGRFEMNQSGPAMMSQVAEHLVNRV